MLDATGERLKHKVCTNGPADEAKHAKRKSAGKPLDQQTCHAGENAEHKYDRCYPPRDIPPVVPDVDEARGSACRCRRREGEAEHLACAAEVLCVKLLVKDKDAE